MFDIAKLFRGGKTKALGLPYPEWSLVRDMWVQMTDDTSKYIDLVYKSNVYAHAIISHIIDKASDAPGEIYRIKNGRKAKAFYALKRGAYSSESLHKSITLKAEAFDEVDGHPFLELMETPNNLMSGKQFKRELLGYERITGNSYMYAATMGVGSRGGEPKELWVIPSPCVEIVMGTRVDPVAGYKISYFVEDIIPKEKIMHMKTFNPVANPTGGNWLYGMSPAMAGRRTLGEFDAAEMAQGTLFKNMGPGGILSGTDKGSITEGQGVAIQDKFVQRHTGLMNGGGIVITPAQVTWQEMGMSPVDLNLIEAKDDLLQEICAIYNYPKERITGSQNTASQGTADKQVITSCVMPLLRDFDDCITKFIRQAYNDDTLVYISDTQYYPELQEDRKQLSEWLGRSYWLTVNEKRRAMDYDDVPDGDAMLIPSGLMKLEDVVADLGDPNIDLLDEQGVNDVSNERE